MLSPHMLTVACAAATMPYLTDSISLLLRQPCYYHSNCILTKCNSACEICILCLSNMHALSRIFYKHSYHEINVTENVLFWLCPIEIFPACAQIWLCCEWIKIPKPFCMVSYMHYAPVIVRLCYAFLGYLDFDITWGDHNKQVLDS